MSATAEITWHPRWVGTEPRPPRTADFQGRPLLVIDVEDSDQIGELADVFVAMRGRSVTHAYDMTTRDLHVALLKDVFKSVLPRPLRRSPEEVVRIFIRKVCATNPPPEVLAVIAEIEAELDAGTHDSQRSA